MTDIFGVESRRLSVKELASGTEVRLGLGDSRLFSIERK
jgi:hypothetical protein